MVFRLGHAAPAIPLALGPGFVVSGSGFDERGTRRGETVLARRGLLPWFVASVILVLAFPGLSASPRSFVATVQRVSDGDTLTAITADGTKLRIRLLGIDAPEIAHGKNPGQPFGEAAWDYLDHLTSGKTVRVDAYGPDRYHRILAVIWDGRVNLNLLMVTMGYAEVYRRVPCQANCPELERAEAKARRDRFGMWNQAGYVSPAAFRRRMRLAGE